MNKLYLLLLLSITIVLPLISSAEFDNIKRYDETTKTATIENAFGLPNYLGGYEIAKVKLDTPLKVEVGLGYQKVFEYTIDSYVDYNNFIQELEVYNLKAGNIKENKKIDLKYKDIELREVQTYEYFCENKGEMINNSGSCSKIKGEIIKEKVEVWKELDSLNMKMGKITISGWTDVNQGDYYEWVPNFGGVKVNEWATWSGELTNGLTAYYKLDETSGTIMRDSYSVNNGTINGATINQTGKIGVSYLFDGSNDESVTNAFATAPYISMSVWVYPKKTETKYALLKGNTAIGAGIMMVNTNKVRFFANNTYADSSTNYTLNAWNHIVGTYNGTHIKVYINSVERGVTTASASTISDLTNLSVGSAGGSLFFNGSVDEIGIWNRQLSQTEIDLLYNGGSGITYEIFTPTITLNAPVNAYNSSSSSITFNATAVSTTEITNVSLYLNGILNETNTSGINATDYLFTKTIADGNYNWSINSCNSAGCTTSATRTFTIDTTPPVLSGVALNTSIVYSIGDKVKLNFTATDTHLSTCWYEYNGANTTVAGCQSGVQNQTDITTVAGQTTIRVWANDTFGWNSTASSVSFAYDTFAPNITLNYPTPIVDYERLTTNLQLNITFTDGNLDKCWYNYNGTNISLPGCQSGIYNVSNINLTTKKNITIYANDTAQNFNTTLFSWDYKVFENSRTSDASTFDTATANYGVNITTNSSLTGVVLYYNGSSYAMNDQGNGIWNISRQLPSSVIGTQNFSYRFQYAGDTIQGENSTQTVAETIFTLCNATYTTRVLNITFKDENSLSAINASIPTSTFVYYVGNGTINKTLTYSNVDTNMNYSFCATTGTTLLNVLPTVQYKQGTSYPQRIWMPSVKQYNSTMTTQILYLLNTIDGLYVTFQVIDNSDATISGVEVNVSRDISGEDIQVASGTTDSGGLVTFWLNPDFQHSVSFTKSGYNNFTTSLFPTQTSYTITLGSSSSTPVGETTGISYGIKPTDNFLTYYTIQDFEFTIGSSYWELDEFGFDLNWSNGTLIGSNSSTTSSGGTISIQDLNVSNASSIVMTPYYTVDSVKYTLNKRFWYLQSSEGREFSLYQWFSDFTTYTSTGTPVLGFNDFGKLLLTALVLILLVGGLSQRYGLQSESAITGIIFSVIFFLEYTLEWIPLITTPLGTLPRGTITIVSAIILIATMIAGERR